MVSFYHSTVQKGVILVGEELQKRKRVKKVLTGNGHPLSITDYNSKLVVNYQPDVYFKLRNNKKMIFEILDSEEQKQDIIIADVIRSFLVEDVDSLIFIYKGDEEVEMRIIESLVTISMGLVYKGIPQNELPFGKSGVIRITKKQAMSPENVKREILKRRFSNIK
ncbi:MAG: hypothetical protein QS98_C0005G0020 [archaeon GW2011_AR3]|nr:MAG: hypothetical protein QS98_C0005G0020 [archaeon GW2011_AR3]MBS3109472.1 hypothetical protein [Candidatus Woesearchaeota archaeon]